MESLISQIWRYGKQHTAGGSVSARIPELAAADLAHLGICVQQTDGNFYECGDTEIRFPLEDLAIVPALMLILEELGEENLLEKVRLDQDCCYQASPELADARPGSPLCGAGAMAAFGCIPGRTGDARFEKMLDYLRLVTGDAEIESAPAVVKSELARSDWELAQAYGLKAAGILNCDAAEHIDMICRLRSLQVNCRDLAQIAAVLANDGRAIDGSQQFMTRNNLRTLRSLMVAEGMGRVSGSFAAKVGMPAKSSENGGILAVAPGHVGIGIYGPALDTAGNSIGGVKMLEQISAREELSIF